MHICVYFVNRLNINHKLTYSKTVKADLPVAILAITLSLIVAYIGLNSLGGSSVDMSDLTSLVIFFLLILQTLINLFFLFKTYYKFCCY